MRIAVSAEDNNGLESQVAHHFGRCPYFAIIDVEDKEIINYELIENPYFETHQPGQVPAFISEQEAQVMLSGGMGRRAIEFFDQFGIRIATGAAGSVGEASMLYLNGGLEGKSSCAQSEDHHHSHSGHHHGHGH